jgi:tetratricopeptide (TPR) repeat protein
MKKILLMALIFLSLIVCVTSRAWAGGSDDFKAGVAAAQRENYDEAIRLFTKAIASGELRGRDLYLAYYNRGTTWYHKEDYDRAITDFTKAIEIDPNDGRAYYNRGVCWEMKGDDDKADADFAKAKELMK